MMARIRCWSGFREVPAWPTPCKFFVITKALGSPGYTLTHTTTGMSMGVRSSSKKLLRLYAAIFGGWGVPWGSIRTIERVKVAPVPASLLRWRWLIAAET